MSAPEPSPDPAALPPPEPPLAPPQVEATPWTWRLALVLAVPLGIGSAIFLAELAKGRAAATVSFVMELLAAIPSIVYGIWGFFVLAPFLRTLLEPWLIANFGYLPLFRGTPFGIGSTSRAICKNGRSGATPP